jgi:hypothetical protein
MKTAVAIALVGLFLGACAKDKTTSTSSSQPRIVSAAAPEQEAMFNQIKGLAGKWSVKGSDANMKGEIDFAVSSNGSIVRETMFPGTPHEMTNVYHLDGPSVVMTHYCAMGNQPRMRATTGDKAQIAFHCDSVTNMTSPTEMYMGEMTLTFKDKDHVSENWRHTKDGKIAPAADAFEMTREK